MTDKKEWENALDAKISSTLKESYRLLGKAVKRPDPAIAKLVAAQLDEATALMLMRKTSKHISEKDYDFDIDEDGDAVFHHRTEDCRPETPLLEGYI